MLSLLVPILATLSAAPPAEPPADPGTEPPSKGSELLERATADLERIHRAFKEVLARVEDARYEKDLVKLLCADDKLVRLKVLVAVAEKADVALAEAVSAKDDAAAIEVSKIAIARGKSDALRAEAAGCIGQLAYDVGGKTHVVVEESMELPEAEAPTASANPTADASPFREDFGLPLPGWR